MSRMCSSKSSGRSGVDLRLAMAPFSPVRPRDSPRARRKGGYGLGGARAGHFGGDRPRPGPCRESPTPRATGRPTSCCATAARPTSARSAPSDAELLVDFYSRVSDQSKYFRFFSPMPELSAKDVKRFTQVDHVTRVALVLLLSGRMIAVGRYDVVRPGRRRGGLPGGGRAPGPRDRAGAARAPGPGRPGARRRAVRRRGPPGQQPDDPDLPRRRATGWPASTRTASSCWSSRSTPPRPRSG